MTQRSNSGWSRKPCPGCGSTNGRPVDQLCHSCSELLALAENYDARAKAEQAGKIYAWVELRPWSFWHHGAGNREVRLDYKDIETLGKTWEAFLNTVGDVVPPGADIRSAGITPISLPSKVDKEYREHNRRVRLMLVSAEQAAAIDALNLAIRAALDASYERGYATGNNLLFGLASGDVAMNTYNEATTNGGKRKP